MAGEAAQVVIAATQQKGILNVDSGKPQAKGSTRQHVVSESMHDPDVFGTMPAVRQCSVLTFAHS